MSLHVPPCLFVPVYYPFIRSLLYFPFTHGPVVYSGTNEMNEALVLGEFWGMYIYNV